MVAKYPSVKFINLDAMYYCASHDNVTVSDKPNYFFVKGKVQDKPLVEKLLIDHQIDAVLHFAAQSHVDNSFGESLTYTEDNVLGTHVLLESCRRYNKIKRFIHVSTDEVYGESNKEGDTTVQKMEQAVLCPTNPYAATKAAAEMIVNSYIHSYNMPIIITRGNNVYGRNQYPEKLIPKFIQLLQMNKKMTIQGKGNQLRSFLHVDDVARAFELVLLKGKLHEIYNVGTTDEITVMEVAKKLLELIHPGENIQDWITYIKDREYNDFRYFITNDKLIALGWKQEIGFDEGMLRLVKYNMEIVFDEGMLKMVTYNKDIEERVKYYIKNWQNKQTIVIPEKAKAFKQNELIYYTGPYTPAPENFAFQHGCWEKMFWRNQELALDIPCLTISADGINNQGLPAIAKVRYIDDKKGSILGPLHYNRHWGEIKNAKKQFVCWKKKKSTCIWRGTPTGFNQNCSAEPKNWKNTRMAFCYKWKDKFDIGISQTMNKWDHKYLKPKMTIKEMLNYKYIISIPGNDKDSGLNWKLASNSVVLMAPPKIESWLMEGLLKPWVHYVPLADDYSDLDKIVEWCKNNDEKCQEIVKNANKFMKQFENIKIERKIFNMIKEHYKNTFTFI